MTNIVKYIGRMETHTEPISSTPIRTVIIAWFRGADDWISWDRNQEAM